MIWSWAPWIGVKFWMWVLIVEVPLLMAAGWMLTHLYIPIEEANGDERLPQLPEPDDRAELSQH